MTAASAPPGLPRASPLSCVCACPPPPAAPLQLGERQGLLAGFTLGSTHLVFFAAYALAIWYGSGRVADGDMDTGKASRAWERG